MLPVMLLSGMLLIFANMSVEPIITLYVAQFVHQPHQVTLMAGVTMSAAALGSILSAARLGRLADRIGHWRVLIAGQAVAALLLILQAFITSARQLVALRFCMGVALGGLLPCIASLIRHHAPAGQTGKALGFSTSAQYVGR